MSGGITIFIENGEGDLVPYAVTVVFDTDSTPPVAKIIDSEGNQLYPAST